MKKIFCSLSFFFLGVNAFCQIGLGITTPHPNAYFQVNSTTKGVLLPRMTAFQRLAMAPAATANGLIVYDTDSTAFMYWTGSIWKKVGGSEQLAWSLNGNAGTSPGTNILGTSDAADLAIGCNSIPRMYVTNEAEVGIGSPNPLYGLDITTGTSGIDNCTYNGIRVKNLLANPSDQCESGLLMGYANPIFATDDEAVITNFGLNNNPVKSLAFGTGTNFTMMRLTSNGMAGIAPGNMTPTYSLDINNGAAGQWPCGRNGIRLNTLQAANNPCDNGLFVGYDREADNNTVSIWNFSSDDFSRNRFLRFGFGADFSESPIGESMRIMPPGMGVGINQVSPEAMLHITNYSGGGVLPGVMVTSPTLSQGQRGLFMGLQTTAPGNDNDGYIWNYQNAPIIAGTNNVERMRISANGNIGIGNSDPGFLFDVNNRMRIRSGGNLANSAGVWLNRSDNSAVQSFIGNETDNTVGFYGTGSGWSFTMNTNTGKVKIADGTQANGRVLSCDASGVASWVNSSAVKPAVQGVFAGSGANLTTSAGMYINAYIDLPPGKYIVFGTYLLAHGASTLQAGQAQWVRTTFSESPTVNSASPDIIGSSLISGSLSYPNNFGLANGQVLINNTSGGIKRYYVWAGMQNTGGQPAGYSLSGIGSNFWGENNLTAVPMN